jgi:hypothetical protein
MTVAPTSFTSNGGAPGAPQNKPTIQFGSVGVANPNSSPAMGTPPSLAYQNASNLGVSQLNARGSSPSNPPSPIPQPAAASGGRPPASRQGQNNGLSFGQIGQMQADAGDFNVSSCIPSS